MRKPVFAGSFYPSRAEEIVSFFSGIRCPENKIKAMGAVSPHAGYIYSGKTAYKTLCSIEIPDNVIILCPNHRGLGWAIAVSPDESWETPFGIVPVNMELSEKIAEFPLAKMDSTAHAYEHSLEVQLPILKMLNPDFKLTAVSIALGDKEVLKDFAKHISQYIEKENTLIVASSDMSHYVPADYAAQVDGEVIKALEKLDPDLMYHTVEQLNVSMCGVFPAYVMLNAVKEMGAVSGKVIEYTNSGELTGDFSEVVAYLGMIFY